MTAYLANPFVVSTAKALHGVLGKMCLVHWRLIGKSASCWYRARAADRYQVCLMRAYCHDDIEECRLAFDPI